MQHWNDEIRDMEYYKTQPATTDTPLELPNEVKIFTEKLPELVKQANTIV